MGAKVTFDSVNKIIQVDIAPVLGIVDIDVKIDIYSDGKEDWKTDATLNKFLFPVTAVGGDPLPGSKALGSTFFLEYGWVIRPYEADHTMQVNGNLYSRDDDSPYIPTTGNFNVFTIQSVSSLVDSTVQQLTEIEHAAFNGGVTIDTINGTIGTTYPIGTTGTPAKSLTDAHIIADARGFIDFFVVGDLLITDEDVSDGHIFVGQSKTLSTITVQTLANVTNAQFQKCTLEGVLDGGSAVVECDINHLDYVNGKIEYCGLKGKVTLGGTTQASFINCHSEVPGGGATPEIDMGGSGNSLVVRGYEGGLELSNCVAAVGATSVDMSSGQVIIASTISAGEFTIRGVAKVVDNSTGTAVVIDETVGIADINVDDIAIAVWEKTINGAVAGSYGELVKHTGFQEHIHIDEINGIVGTTYPLGTHLHPVNNAADAVTIGIANGISRIKVAEDCTFAATDNIDGFVINGIHASKSQFTFTAGVSTQFTEFTDATMTGTTDGFITVRDSVIDDLVGFQGILHQTMINGTLTLAGIQTAHILDCFSGVAGISTPSIDMGGTGASLAMRNYNGGIKIENKTGTEKVSIDLNSGQVIIDGTVTAGEIVVRGTGHLTDNSSGATIITDGLINTEVAALVDDIFNAVISGYIDADSFGQWLNIKGLTVQKFFGTKNN